MHISFVLSGLGIRTIGADHALLEGLMIPALSSVSTSLSNKAYYDVVKLEIPVMLLYRKELFH